MMLLGSMRAEERLAPSCSTCPSASPRGVFSPSEFHLRMTRDEIGSYLGPEARDGVPRLLPLPGRGPGAVQQKHIRILDTPGLKRLLNHHAA